MYRVQRELQDELVGFAILSHRWRREEVTYRGMKMVGDDALRSKLRETRSWFRKLESFCRLAKSLGYAFAWADTCCIDKSSSVELDETIRSMYTWYSSAGICTAHLADTA